MGKGYDIFSKLTSDMGKYENAYIKIDEVLEKAFGDEAPCDGLDGLVKKYDKNLEAPVCKISYNKEENLIEFKTRAFDEEQYGLSCALMLDKCDALFAGVWVLRKIDEFEWYGYRVLIDSESLPMQE